MVPVLPPLLSPFLYHAFTPSLPHSDSSLPLFLSPVCRIRPARRPDRIDNSTMQVPRRRDAWCWFPSFTYAGEPGQPRAAVRACALQHVYAARAREKEQRAMGGAGTSKGFGKEEEKICASRLCSHPPIYFIKTVIIYTSHES